MHDIVLLLSLLARMEPQCARHTFSETRAVARLGIDAL
jgi:hypothetical protein